MRLKAINAADMVADITSTAFKVGKAELVTMVADWSGASDTPTGVLRLQYSPDYVKPGTVTATWYNIAAFTTSPAASASSTAEPFRGLSGWYRVFYDMTSLGDGDELTVWVEISEVR